MVGSTLRTVEVVRTRETSIHRAWRVSQRGISIGASLTRKRHPGSWWTVVARWTLVGVARREEIAKGFIKAIKASFTELAGRDICSASVWVVARDAAVRGLLGSKRTVISLRTCYGGNGSKLTVESCLAVVTLVLLNGTWCESEHTRWAN